MTQAEVRVATAETAHCVRCKSTVAQAETEEGYNEGHGPVRFCVDEQACNERYRQRFGRSLVPGIE